MTCSLMTGKILPRYPHHWVSWTYPLESADKPQIVISVQRTFGGHPKSFWFTWLATETRPSRLFCTSLPRSLHEDLTEPAKSTWGWQLIKLFKLYLPSYCCFQRFEKAKHPSKTSETSKEPRKIRNSPTLELETCFVYFKSIQVFSSKAPLYIFIFSLLPKPASFARRLFELLPGLDQRKPQLFDLPPVGENRRTGGYLCLGERLNRRKSNPFPGLGVVLALELLVFWIPRTSVFETQFVHGDFSEAETYVKMGPMELWAGVTLQHLHTPKAWHVIVSFWTCFHLPLKMQTIVMLLMWEWALTRSWGSCKMKPIGSPLSGSNV